jgi:N,N'-diacetyllegionaminate synthase
VPAFRVCCGDVTHEPLLRALGGYGRPVLLSTGLATPEEVEQACEALERGAGAAERRPPVLLMQCAVDPLAAASGADVRTVTTLRERFGCLVGWSDHGAGYVHAIAAVALGACIVEKPFTDDRRRAGGDHARSLEPLDFAAMTMAIRGLEAALGDGSLPGADAHAAANGRMRRGIYAARSLPSGTVLDAADLKVVRPALGAAPAALARLVGRRLTRRLAVDEPLRDDECGTKP